MLRLPRLLDIMSALLIVLPIGTESTLLLFPKRSALIIRMMDVLYQYQGDNY